MRVVSWAFVLCTLLGAIAAFLPSVELGSQVIGRHVKLSLYTASTDRAAVRKLLAVYHASEARQTGGELVRAVSPKLRGRAAAAIGDLRDAMDTLDDTSDDDVRTAGTIFTIALWTLLGLDALMIALVFRQLSRARYHRGALIAALVLSVLAAGVAVALAIACRVAVWEANDAVGATVLTLAAGAYVLPLAAIAGLILAVVLVILRRKLAAPPRPAT